MIVENATAADLPEILELEAHFDRPWSEESWRQEVTGGGRLVLIARRQDGATVGVASFQLVDEVADLHRIVVAPEQRRLGFARVMLMAGLQWAIGRGARRMLLEVDSGNAAAIQLYQGYGFAAVATRPDYYGPGADALILERRLEGVDADSVGTWDMEEDSDDE
ncbi:GNAT family N-acetyltransferase [Tessaracoccus sp. Z1128]